MKASLKWLNKYADLSGISAEQIAEALPMLGLEVESVETLGLKPLDRVVVGEILSREPHPDSDHLGVCMVKVSPDSDPIQIVCGASNYKVGDRVPVALSGAKLPTEDGKGFEIKVSKLRGVESNGMMCSARELGLGQDHSGLLILESRPEIGTPINDVFTDSDTVFEIELTANRGDCLSHIGIARELAAKFGRQLKKPELKYAPKYSAAPAGGLLESVELKTPNCPMYCAVSVKGVKIAPSPEWMRRDLEAVGLRPINNVVDVTNYVLMEYGQPLHAFDARRISGGKIIVRQAEEGEKIQTLDEKIHTLSTDVTLICDGSRAVAMAGVMGGLNSEVEDDTADVVIEAAYFNPGNIRSTSRRYSISTDSSYRFARDVDPRGTLEAARRAADLIAETAGGEIVETACLVGSAPRAARDIEISRKFIEDNIGFEAPSEEIERVFRSLGFGVESSGDGKWKVNVPTFRSDVDRPVDLVEEYVRMIGSDRIPEVPVISQALIRDDDPLFKYNCAAADYLCSRGLNECQNYTLKDSSKQALLYAGSELLKLANPLTSDQDSLRASLIDGLLDAAATNLSNANGFFGFFENGEIFRPDASGEISELSATAFALVSGASETSWREPARPDFYAAKRLVCDLLSILGVDAGRLNFSQVEGEPVWEAGFAAGCGSEKREGFRVRFGAVSVAHLRGRGIDKTVWAGEISFRPDVAGRKKSAEKFKAFPSFPPSSRDLAVIVEDSEPAKNVSDEIVKIAGQKTKGKGFELESCSIFDIYRGKGVPEGFKSLACALRFRSGEKTLQTEEVNGVFDAICQELSKKRKLRAQ